MRDSLIKAQHLNEVRLSEAGYTCAVDADVNANESLQRGGVHIRPFVID
jgi:hypothetical protein